MKKLSIILISILVAFAACTKSKEVHPEIGDGNDEIVTVGMKDVHVEYTRTDHERIDSVWFTCWPFNANGQWKCAKMTKKETFFELTLTDLLSDTLYKYFYELYLNDDSIFTAEKTFHTLAYNTPEPPEPPTPPLDHEYVDLGLPSGLLWATCNVGANAPEEYGDYFAWGETRPKDYYYWNTYQYNYGNTHNGDQLTKYCNDASYGFNGFTDSLTVLQLSDDAATANWGGDWRMPTKEEWRELFNNTTCTWTTQNGVNGELFTASNGNGLFLPAAGYRHSSTLYAVGSLSDYWSSSLRTETEPFLAWSLYIYSDDYFACSSRDQGKSIRPVREN